MSKIIKMIAACYLMLLTANTCFANHDIFPVKMDGQDEIFINGGVVIRSEKQFSMELYQTRSEIKNGKANFYFAVANNTNRLVNIHFNDLMVTDQLGNPLRVVTKNELLNSKKNCASWKHFFSAICTFADSCQADKAGDINYNETSCSSYNSRASRCGLGRVSCVNSNTSAISSTSGQLHCEALRQQAQRQVYEDASLRTSLIEQEYIDGEYAVKNFYFDSNTVFPNTIYGANFYVDVPRQLERGIQYIFVNFYIENELHTFCFMCLPK